MALGSCEKGFFAKRIKRNGTVLQHFVRLHGTVSQSHVLCCTYRWNGGEQLFVVQCSKWQSGKAMTHVHSAPEPHRLGTDVFGLWQ